MHLFEVARSQDNIHFSNVNHAFISNSLYIILFYHAAAFRHIKSKNCVLWIKSDDFPQNWEKLCWNLCQFPKYWGIFEKAENWGQKTQITGGLGLLAPPKKVHNKLWLRTCRGLGAFATLVPKKVTCMQCGSVDKNLRLKGYWNQILFQCLLQL